MHVHIVDDDGDIRASLSVILGRAGHQVSSFSNAHAFLLVANNLPVGCVLLDLRLPDMDGLQVQARLAEISSDHAVVLLTGYGEVPEAVSAIRAGAVDFLKKPFKQEALTAALKRAEATIILRSAEREQRAQYAPLDKLSSREREILSALAQGRASKVVAFDLGISVRTVDMHRANILRKLNVPNTSAALVMAQAAGMIEKDCPNGPNSPPVSDQVPGGPSRIAVRGDKAF